jgi:hypothetical protein
MAPSGPELLSPCGVCGASASSRENRHQVAYPRSCPVCAINYGATGATDRGHVTIRSDPGGTPSPWRPKQPGRILTLKCMTCSDDFVWDYFGSSIVTPRGGSGIPDEPRRV